MAGVGRAQGGGSGGHNRSFTPSVPPRTGKDPGSWPWSNARKLWTRQRIRKTVIAFLVKHGLCVDERERDLAETLSLNHWLLHSAIFAIDTCDPDDSPRVGARCAYVAMGSASSAIVRAWVLLGVRAESKAEQPKDDGEADPFWEQFEEPTGEPAPTGPYRPGHPTH